MVFHRFRIQRGCSLLAWQRTNEIVDANKILMAMATTIAGSKMCVPNIVRKHCKRPNRKVVHQMRWDIGTTSNERASEPKKNYKKWKNGRDKWH